MKVTFHVRSLSMSNRWTCCFFFLFVFFFLALFFFWVQWKIFMTADKSLCVGSASHSFHHGNCRWLNYNDNGWYYNPNDTCSCRLGNMMMMMIIMCTPAWWWCCSCSCEAQMNHLTRCPGWIYTLICIFFFPLTIQSIPASGITAAFQRVSLWLECHLVKPDLENPAEG